MTQRDLFPPGPLFEAAAQRQGPQAAPAADPEPFDWGPAVYTYTRRQAVEDGVLWSPTGDPAQAEAAEIFAAAGRQWIHHSGAGGGDDSQSDRTLRAAFCDVAMTAAAFNLVGWPVDNPAAAAWLTKRHQDVNGRLHDVASCAALWCKRAGLTAAEGRGCFLVQSIIAPGADRRAGRANVRLVLVVGPNDDGAPCLTIMLPTED